MKVSGGLDSGYVLARKSLLDAIEALQVVSTTGFIIVGAQAVYLRTQEAQISIPPFTLDGDILANPRLVRRARIIADTLETAGFVPRGKEHGLYHRATAPENERRATAIDLFVPARFDNEWELNGYTSKDASAVMKQEGLELALFDNSLLQIADDASQRTLTAPVAGPASLVIAKAWKLGERYGQGPEEFSRLGKDVLDVYRLLFWTENVELLNAIRTLPRDHRVVETAKQGASYLADLCLSGKSPALTLLRDFLGSLPEARLILNRLPPLVKEFTQIVEDRF